MIESLGGDVTLLVLTPSSFTSVGKEPVTLFEKSRDVGPGVMVYLVYRDVKRQHSAPLKVDVRSHLRFLRNSAIWLQVGKFASPITMMQTIIPHEGKCIYKNVHVNANQRCGSLESTYPPPSLQLH